MTADGPLVRYEFAGTPPTVVQVHYNEDNSQLEESTAGATEKLTPSNFDKKILGTDLSYEDLALRFVYWSRATITGDDNIRTRDAWKLTLNAPTHRTEYSSVNLWVDKESGALLQAEAYDWQGKPSNVSRSSAARRSRANGISSRCASNPSIPPAEKCATVSRVVH